LLRASIAYAAPAVVKVFEADARAAPDAKAAVVQVLPEKTEVSVSEEITNGWRRVRLQDGKTAFIRDEDVRLASASTAVEPLVPAAGGGAAASKGPVIYVKDLDHLAELVSSDNVVHPKVLSIQSKRRRGYGVMLGSMAAGSVLLVGSMTFLGHEHCIMNSPGSPDVCYTETSVGWMSAGFLVAIAGWFAGFMMLPDRNDFLDVINTWNTRHVDEQFTLDHEPAAAAH
jgi:hypothetical protein